MDAISLDRFLRVGRYTLAEWSSLSAQEQAAVALVEEELFNRRECTRELIRRLPQSELLARLGKVDREAAEAAEDMALSEALKRAKPAGGVDGQSA